MCTVWRHIFSWQLFVASHFFRRPKRGANKVSPCCMSSVVKLHHLCDNPEPCVGTIVRLEQCSPCQRTHHYYACSHTLFFQSLVLHSISLHIIFSRPWNCLVKEMHNMKPSLSPFHRLRIQMGFLIRGAGLYLSNKTLSNMTPPPPSMHGLNCQCVLGGGGGVEDQSCRLYLLKGKRASERNVVSHVWSEKHGTIKFMKIVLVSPGNMIPSL